MYHLSHAAGTSHVQVIFGFHAKPLFDYFPLALLASFLFLSCPDSSPARVCFAWFFRCPCLRFVSLPLFLGFIPLLVRFIFQVSAFFRSCFSQAIAFVLGTSIFLPIAWLLGGQLMCDNQSDKKSADLCEIGPTFRCSNGVRPYDQKRQLSGNDLGQTRDRYRRKLSK